MPPPSATPGSPQDWLARARGKLALAKQPLPAEGFLEDLCFFAQQAAEQAIKAVYLQQGWRFAFIHDLDLLLTGLSGHGMIIPSDVQDADQLSPFAAQFRYPGAPMAISQAQYQDAVRIAENVVNWASTLIP